jgi:hypothetical protein
MRPFLYGSHVDKGSRVSCHSTQGAGKKITVVNFDVITFTAAQDSGQAEIPCGRRWPMGARPDRPERGLLCRTGLKLDAVEHFPAGMR